MLACLPLKEVKAALLKFHWLTDPGIHQSQNIKKNGRFKNHIKLQSIKTLSAVVAALGITILDVET